VNCGCRCKKLLAINCGWLEVGASIINITTTNKMDNMQTNYQKTILFVNKENKCTFIIIILLLYYYYDGKFGVFYICNNLFFDNAHTLNM
jgi:hypothetical protein